MPKIKPSVLGEQTIEGEEEEQEQEQEKGTTGRINR